MTGQRQIQIKFLFIFVLCFLVLRGQPLIGMLPNVDKPTQNMECNSALRAHWLQIVVIIIHYTHEYKKHP